MARRRTREDALLDAMRDEARERVVDAIVYAGASRLCDIARISGVRLNLVWELSRELDAAGLILIDPFGHGSVFALPKATRAAERRSAHQPSDDTGDAA